MTCSECKIETLGEYGELCCMSKAVACGVSRDTHLGAEGVSWDGKRLCIRLTGSKQHCGRHLCRGSDGA
jgi:hypothetical protein